MFEFESQNFNPHPPWGGRQGADVQFVRDLGISIHTLRGEGDYQAFTGLISTRCISIHTLRGEGDVLGDRMGKYIAISIHTLRGEGDDI